MTTFASTVARRAFDEEDVTFDAIEAGDWISGGWSRPRLVQRVEWKGDTRLLYLAEPDEERANEDGFRVVSPTEFAKREWKRFPYLRVLCRLWED